MIPKLTMPVIPVCKFRQNPINMKIDIDNMIFEILNILIRLAFAAESATGIHKIIRINNMKKIAKVTLEKNGPSRPYVDFFFNCST